MHACRSSLSLLGRLFEEMLKDGALTPETRLRKIDVVTEMLSQGAGTSQLSSFRRKCRSMARAKLLGTPKRNGDQWRRKEARLFVPGERALARKASFYS